MLGHIAIYPFFYNRRFPIPNHSFVQQRQTDHLVRAICANSHEYEYSLGTRRYPVTRSLAITFVQSTRGEIRIANSTKKPTSAPQRGSIPRVNGMLYMTVPFERTILEVTDAPDEIQSSPERSEKCTRRRMRADPNQYPQQSRSQPNGPTLSKSDAAHDQISGARESMLLNIKLKSVCKYTFVRLQGANTPPRFHAKSDVTTQNDTALREIEGREAHLEASRDARGSRHL